MAEYKTKRRHPRYPCDTGVKILPEMGSKSYWGTLSDISMGGCYVCIPSPLPVGQTVTLSIKTANLDLNVAGKAVSSHPGFGMGVAFRGFAREGEKKLKTLLDHLAAQPRPTHALGLFR
jgi:hypothetical protein